MKITIIFPKFTGPFGGERLVLKLASELIKMNIRVDLITNKFNSDCQHLLHRDINLIDKDFPISKNHNISTFLSLFYMPKLVKSIDIKSSNVICGIGWQSAYGLKKLIDINYKNVLYYCLEPPRFLYDLKNSINISFINSYIIKIISPFIKNIDYKSIANIKNIYSISGWTQNQVKNIYNKSSKIIYPGVEENRFIKLSKASSRKFLNIPEESTIYLSVSKLHKRKNIFEAINVFNNQRNQINSNSKFYIIGDGPEKENIQKYIAKNNLPGLIILISNVSDDIVNHYYAASDFFIFTATNEPFGIAPLEAKLAGCKIIPHDINHPILSWKESTNYFLSAIKDDY